MNLHRQLREPIRYPDTKSRTFMTRRAWWLVLLAFLLPGSAQILTGKRALGRFGLVVTFISWLFGLLCLLGFFFARETLLTLFTNSWFLMFGQIALVFYGIVWVVLGLDALRLTKIVRVRPSRRLFVALLSLCLTLVPALGAWSVASKINAGREAISAIFANKAPAVAPVNGRYNILLLGTDAGADREGLRPDSISLISVNAQTGESVIIGLPRELHNMPFPEKSPLRAKYPQGFGVSNGCNTGVCFLNSAYADTEYFMPELYPDAKKKASSPGIEATKDAVSGATGLQVQFYVMVNMDSFAKLIDSLGGITITVKDRVQVGGDEYGNHVIGYIEPGTQKMNGSTALSYARMRHGAARGDYDRMERQRELQTAILAQMTPTNVLLRFQDIAKSGKYLAQTDIPESMLGTFTELATKSRAHQPVKVELAPPKIEPEDPDYETVYRLVQDAIVATTPKPKGQ